MPPVSPIALKALVQRSDRLVLEPSAGVAVRLPVRLAMLDAHGTLAPADEDLHPGELVTLTAPLPPGDAHVELSPQGRGLASKLAQLRERRLGIAPLDDAFLIHCDDDGFTTLHQVADALVALLPCPTHGRLHLGPHQLVVTWSPHQLDAVARLWERLYTMRLSS
jgi:hypothetical protein